MLRLDDIYTRRYLYCRRIKEPVVNNALRKMRNRKSVGLDEITIEILEVRERNKNYIVNYVIQ